MKLPCSDKFTLEAALRDDVVCQEWHLAGLPKDSFSVENAMMVAESQRWPLIIDPQSQAVRWIKNTAARAGRVLVSTRQTDREFGRNLETALQFGRTLLVENVGEELDSMLEP
eukprot:2100597-Pyramimonas_sp.AAC.1